VEGLSEVFSTTPNLTPYLGGVKLMEEFKRQLEHLAIEGQGIPVTDFTQGILLLVEEVVELKEENKDLRSRLEDVEANIDHLRDVTGIT
jgi:hypothetical protein